MNLKSPQFIDIHSHVNFAAFDADREGVLKRAEDAGVWMINVGTQQDTSKSAVELAEKYDRGVFAAVGLHPIHTDKSHHDEDELGVFSSVSSFPKGGGESASRRISEEQEKSLPLADSGTPFKKGRIRDTGFTSRGEEFNFDFYKKLAEHPKVVAIGECGLDYYRIKNYELGITNEEGNRKQEETFRKHIELAVAVGKPLMLHVRNGSGRSAYRDALSILNSYFVIHNSRVRANFHFFAGSWKEAREILDAGFSISFTGVITFARNYDEVIKNAPLDRIMSETDCPYVAPAPYRGKRNEPAYVVEVVKKIAEIREEEFEKVRAQLVENAVRFFGLV